MNKEQEDGGPAFPCRDGTGMSLREWFATFAPCPTDAEIESQYKLDRARNPHNEPRKPNIRSKIEIVADLAFEYADAMLEAKARK